MSPQEYLQNFSSEPVALGGLLLHLAIGIALAMLLRWHFARYGTTLTNRSAFSGIFLFIVLTTILVITVVKSSLALSLGLVGALSIVRFRTPVKEPEELAYLFLAIAIGLGLGAGQVAATVVCSTVALLAMALLDLRGQIESKNLFVTIALNADAAANDDRGGDLDALSALLLEHATQADLRRFDVRDGALDATYLLDIDDPSALGGLVSAIERRFPGSQLTFVDQGRVPAI